MTGLVMTSQSIFCFVALLVLLALLVLGKAQYAGTVRDPALWPCNLGK
jgi:hypothetical protein